VEDIGGDYILKMLKVLNTPVTVFQLGNKYTFDRSFTMVKEFAKIVVVIEPRDIVFDNIQATICHQNEPKNV
jgi:hypothetical protein